LPPEIRPELHAYFLGILSGNDCAALQAGGAEDYRTFVLRFIANALDGAGGGDLEDQPCPVLSGRNYLKSSAQAVGLG
jgi:hypothetical protein